MGTATPKKGDWVTGEWNGNPYEGIYVEYDTMRGGHFIGLNGNSTNLWFVDKIIEIKTKSFMSASKNIVDKFLLSLKPEPQKSFIKAGITNGDGVLTNEGAELFLAWLLQSNGDAFKTAVVDPILAEDEKSKS